MKRRESSAPEADVALVLEGTYPYVRGGVADWVHQLMHALSDLRFHLIFIGATHADYGPLRYTLPPNVTGLETHFIMESLPRGRVWPAAPARPPVAALERVHEALEAGDAEGAWDATLRLFDPRRGMTVRQFLRAPAVWGLPPCGGSCAGGISSDARTSRS